MKRYMTFLYRHYYPCGGMEDFIGSVDNLEDAIKLVDIEISKDFTEYSYTDDLKEYLEYEKGSRNWHVYDLHEMKIVYTK